MSAAAYVIEVIEGADAGHRLDVGASLEIGREAGLPLTLDDDQASRRHARITVDDAGLSVVDLGSLNGTFVNAQPVESSRRLVAGDHLLIGTTVLELRDAREAAGSPSGVLAVPPVTQLAAEVLSTGQAGAGQAGDDAAPDPDPPPPFRAAEREPGYVAAAPGTEGHSPGSNYEAVAALVDGRVKRRTSATAFAFLSIAALVVIVYFGAT